MTFITGSPDAIECRVRMLRMIMTGLIEVISTTDKAQVKRNGHKYGELTARLYLYSGQVATCEVCVTMLISPN
ncbi:MAG TPA: hypothetical protein DCF72_05355 [Gammaproteobacteria bacterium]|nr:hypothetical protein [Gammaproteobacteria bacterium]